MNINVIIFIIYVLGILSYFIAWMYVGVYKLVKLDMIVYLIMGVSIGIIILNGVLTIFDQNTDYEVEYKNFELIDRNAAVIVGLSLALSVLIGYLTLDNENVFYPFLYMMLASFFFGLLSLILVWTPRTLNAIKINRSIKSILFMISISFLLIAVHLALTQLRIVTAAKITKTSQNK